MPRPRKQAQVFPPKKGSLKKFSGRTPKADNLKGLYTFSAIFLAFSYITLNIKQIITIVGTDANGHHTISGSSNINPRAEDLLA